MTENQTERTRAVIEKLYEAYLSGNTEDMLALMAPDVKVTFNYAGTFTGMAEARPFMTWNGAQLTDLTFNVRHKIIDGNFAAVTWDETAKTIRGDDWEAMTPLTREDEIAAEAGEALPEAPVAPTAG